MNQILITKKLYVTPELKRKKKIYKFNFFISIFILIALISIYVYAEYDRTKSEAVSQEILTDLQNKTQNYVENSTEVKDDVLVAILDLTPEEIANMPEIPAMEESVNLNNVQNTEIKTTDSGYTYSVQATIEIEKLGITYPILLGATGSEEETEELLKISPVRFWGCEPNEVGNYCIAGHNYRDTRFFSKVPTLVNGDIIKITDLTGRTIEYAVYEVKAVEITDVSDTTQLTDGNKEITLITCTDDSSQRIIVKASEVI